MASCSGIKADGERCNGQAIGGSQWCFSHHPDYAERRRRRASKGGKRGGRGRPGSELVGIKAEIRDVIADVLAGDEKTGPGAVALQGYNALIRAEKLELDIREQTDLIERLEDLEALLKSKREGGRRWG
jgi:hypothetical protein